MGAFSSKPTKAVVAKPQVTSVDRTVLDLKNARDRLQRYRTKLAKDDVRLREQAIKAKQDGQTATALGLLRLRKFKQQQTESCEQQLLSVLQMVETIGSQQDTARIVAAMAAGKDTLKQLHEETTVEHVLELMDQIQEQNEYQQEINQALNAVPALSATDEQDVVDELEALQASMMTENNAGVTTTNDATNLPEVPTHKLPDLVGPAVTNTNATTASSSGRIAVPG